MEVSSITYVEASIAIYMYNCKTLPCLHARMDDSNDSDTMDVVTWSHYLCTGLHFYN